MQERKEDLQKNLKEEKDDKQKELIKKSIERIENLKTNIEAHIKAQNDKKKE